MPDTRVTKHWYRYRRLFQIEYTCPLCGTEHTTQQYVTLIAENLPDFQENATTALRGEEGRNSAAHDADLHHQHTGDLIELQDETRRKGGNTRPVIRRVMMTEESHYTCNECGSVFPNITDYSVHMDVDPLTHAGTPACANEAAEQASA